jgi:plastocyanin
MEERFDPTGRTVARNRGHRARRRCATLLAAVVLLAGATVRAGEPSPARVDIQNFRFSPPTLTIPVGTTVTWTNDDEEPHTVTSSTGLFASPGLDNAETFSHRFAAPGTYTYFCALHPHMIATIIAK